MDNSSLFLAWNKIKIHLDESNSSILFREGEIWLCHLGKNIGIEQNGKGGSFVRPVLVLRKYNQRHFLAVPLTTQLQPDFISFKLDSRIPFLKKDSWIIFSQIRVMDSKRLHRKMGKLSGFVFSLVQNKSAQTFVRASGALNGK